jgi:threonine/homoserine/homoserine lactone efflux protein
MPGPLQAFFFSETLQRGWRHSIWLIFAPLLSDGPIIAIALLLLQGASDTFLRGISAVGGAFILYLAYGLYGRIRSGDFEAMLNPKPADEGSVAEGGVALTRWGALRKGVGINALGPGPWIFWGTAMGPLLVDTWRASPVHAVLFVLSFYLTFMLILLGMILLFHQVRRLGPRVLRGALVAGLVALIVFAARLWWGVLAG